MQYLLSKKWTSDEIVHIYTLGSRLQLHIYTGLGRQAFGIDLESDAQCAPITVMVCSAFVFQKWSAAMFSSGISSSSKICCRYRRSGFEDIDSSPTTCFGGILGLKSHFSISSSFTDSLRKSQASHLMMQTQVINLSVGPHYRRQS